MPLECTPAVYGPAVLQGHVSGQKPKITKAILVFHGVVMTVSRHRWSQDSDRQITADSEAEEASSLAD